MNLLIIEDEVSIVNMIRRFLEKEDILIHHASTLVDGLNILNEKLPGVLLLDLNLPDGNGMDLLKEIHTNEFPCETIIITGHGNINIAVETMNNGAFDFLEKPFTGERLAVTVRNAFEHHRLQGIVEEIEQNNRSRFQNFIGHSAKMQTVYTTIENAAPSKATVFIVGESGTGKELCAQAIHKLSPRKKSPFVPINCAAIPKDLVESEIFGHVKGAFTGALKERHGAVSRADHGTLFLDEIGEMNIDLQAKLLRFLQTGQFQRVGANSIETVDVRIVCATNRNPLEEIKLGRFREDLYYRLNVIPITLPPLRERETDTLLIADHFLKKFNQEENKNFKEFSKEVEKIILEHEWPGNVRELENTIRNIVVLNAGEKIDTNMLPDNLGYNKETENIKIFPADTTYSPVLNNNNSISDNTIKPLWEVEKTAILHAIEKCNGNIPKAAALLDVSPSTIYRKKQSWD